MNIKHAENEVIQGDMLEAIFTRQGELVEKYHKIEERSGIVHTLSWPVNLDDPKAQYAIKDYMWRITEEVGEALDASHKSEYDHFCEELIDGLHFLVELTTMVGWDAGTLATMIYSLSYPGVMEIAFDDEDPSTDLLLLVFREASRVIIHHGTLQGLVGRWVMEAGMTCNCLKNKPWKQTHMKTDRDNFNLQLTKAWAVYLVLLKETELAPDEIAQVYLKKSQVNMFRQRSEY